MIATCTRLLLAGLLWLAAVPLANGQPVLDATPGVKVESDEGSTQRYVLTKAERAKARVSIVWLDGKYYWVTREHRELIHLESGANHYFISPTGAGYIKVMDTHYLSPSARPPGPRFRFLEHVSLGLWTLTYFGEADTFTLGDEE